MYSSRIVTTEQVPAKEARLRLAELLDGTLAGRTYEITRGGRPTAVLGPAAPSEETPTDDE